MKGIYTLAYWLLTVLLVPALGGEKNPSSGFQFADEAVPSRHRFAAGVSVLSGATIQFGGLGGFTNLRNTTLGIENGERVYDNGTVSPDSANSSDGLTWNWGYDSADQVFGDAILLKIDNSSGRANVQEEDTAPGFELSYGYVVGDLSSGPGWRWGVKTRLSYHRLTSSGHTRLRNDVERTTDAFGLGGIIPPQAPYSGSFSGPGALLDAQATRSFSTVPELALVTAGLEAEADLFTLGIGPFVEIPLGERLSLDLGLGATATWINSHMEVDQTVSIPGNDSLRDGASNSDSKLLFGGYAEVGLSYAITDSVSLAGFGRWQTMDSFSHGSGGFDVDYDFDHLFIGGLGLVWTW